MDPEISPDGRHIALRRTINGNADIWLFELGRGVLSRFTFDAAPDGHPVWSPNLRRIAFSSNRKPGFASDLYVKLTSGGSEVLLQAAPGVQNPTDWSPDGRFLLYRRGDLVDTSDIWALPMEGEQKPFPVVQTNFDERDGQFSPDGKWVAYQSNESGRFEVYVQSFPGPGSKTLISTNGGAQVRWRRDGKELFYIALDGRLMVVPIRLAVSTVEVSTPVPLFATHVGGAVRGVARQQYVVSSDGQRFLMNTVTEETPAPITVMLNWRPKP